MEKQYNSLKVKMPFKNLEMKVWIKAENLLINNICEDKSYIAN